MIKKIGEHTAMLNDWTQFSLLKPNKCKSISDDILASYIPLIWIPANYALSI